MQLPQINFGGPVQNEAEAGYRQVGAAGERLGEVIERGLTAFGQAMVQTETADAHLRLSAGLSALDQDIRSKRAFSQDELKQVLGDEFERLPDAVKNQPLEPVIGEDGKQVLDGDRPAMKPGDIPAWKVGHLVYQKRAQELLDDSAKTITMGSGWENKFRQAALADVVQRGASLGDHLNQQALQEQVDARTRQIGAYALQGDFNMARTVADGSLDVLGEKGVAAAHAMIGAQQQERPITESLLAFRTDPEGEDTVKGLRDAQAALADDRRTGLMPMEKRNSLANSIAAALKAADEGHQKRTAAGIALQIIQKARDKANPNKIDGVRAGQLLDEAFAEGGRYASKPELFFEAQSMLAKTASDHNAAVKAAFDEVGAEGIRQYLSQDKQGVYHPSSQNLSAQTRAALHASGKDGEDLLKQMMDWDRANAAYARSVESHERSMRNMPSDAEEGRAFRIERSIAVNPGAWRALSGAEQMQVLAGLRTVPGEADAPAVAVSAKDVPQLSGKIAAVSATAPVKYVVSPEKIAFEEAAKAYPILLNGKIRNAQARQALQLLTDKVSTFINAEIGRSGKEPPEADTRKEAAKAMQLVEVKDGFRIAIGGVKLMPKTRPLTRLEAEKAGLDYTEPDQPAPAQKAPPAAQRKTLKNGKTYELRGSQWFEVP